MAKVAIFDHPQEKEGQKPVLLVFTGAGSGKVTFFWPSPPQGVAR
jgi:hypothetical protein